jgi:hypothetical protein
MYFQWKAVIPMIKYLLDSEFIKALSSLIRVSGSSVLCLLAFLMICLVVAGLALFFRENVRHKWGFFAGLFVFAAAIVCVVVFTIRPARAIPQSGPATPPSNQVPQTSPQPSNKENGAAAADKPAIPPKQKSPATAASTTPPDKRPVPTTAPAPSATPPQSAPIQPAAPNCTTVGGICIQGGTVNNPTVNNTYNGPEPPRFSLQGAILHVKRESPNAYIYRQKNLPVPPPTDAVQINILVTMQSSFSNASFVFKCSKPCYRVGFTVIGANSFGDSQGGGNGNDLVVEITDPRVLRSGTQVLFAIQANDGGDFVINEVKPNI